MSAPPVNEDLIEEAIAIATAAASLTLDYFGQRELGVDTKSDGTEVTEADRATEQLVRDMVLQRHPDDTVIGEEFGTTPGTSTRRWIVDPIDGTTSFVRGVPLFAGLLAMFDEHGPALGVVTIPALDHILVAGRARGATLDGNPVGVSDTPDLADALVSSSSFDRGWWPDDALMAVAGSGARTRTWGDGYGYLLVATGAIDAMIEPALNPWDIAPMFTIIPEAGGRLTTWSGVAANETESPTSPGASTRGWVASNGLVHDEVLALFNNG